MILHSSIHNELNINEVKKLIHSSSQIIRSTFTLAGKQIPSQNGTLIANLIVDGSLLAIYSDNYIEINNVRFPLACGPDEFFPRTITISARLEDEIIMTDYSYIDNEDGTYTICYDHNQDSSFSIINTYHTCIVREDDNNYYVDNRCGLGEGLYPKSDYSLLQAIEDQCINENY